MIHAIITVLITSTINRGNTMQNTDNERWISLEEAADHLGVKPTTIRDWIKKDTGIPAHKIGKQWKFLCSELDKWVKSGRSAL